MFREISKDFFHTAHKWLYPNLSKYKKPGKGFIAGFR
jgi:hypothetical protein